uniref:Retrovirus-related Pol polyprotein from transposon TNT 1-94 n=1 Tax=Tanacetum cinerariifolium TaxID=118510 RepID=A0A6L2LU03_TANCI|nr:hypothetical protein [Tanacetum cinerariifolium]
MLFAEYTGIKVKQFRETLLLHMGNVKKSVAERTRHKRQYDRRMNERQMQLRESKGVSSKALDASLVVTECSVTKSDEHITSNSFGTYITHVVDADIRPVNDQEPSVEVHLTTQHNVLANEQQHTDQSEPSYDTYLLKKVDRNTTLDSTNMCHKEGEIDQDAEQDQVKISLLKAEFLKTNDMVEKEVYNELSNRFLQLEKHCISFEISIQQKEESFQSNKPLLNYYLEEAKKKTQNKIMNLKPSVVHTTSLQDTTNGHKPKPRSNNQTSRSFPVPKSSRGMLNGVTLVDHSMNSSSFSDSKHFVCSTCQKCAFNANHDDCITKFLKEVNYRAKVQSLKSRNNIKPAKGYLMQTKVKDGSLKDIGYLPISLPLCMRNQTLLDLVLGGNQRVEFSRLVVLGGYLLERCLSIAQPSSGLALNRQMAFADNTSGLAPQRKERFEIYIYELKGPNDPQFLESIVPAAVAASRAIYPASSPSSTTIDQDVPSASTSPTIQEIQSQVTHQDPSSEETTLQGFIPSNLHHLNQSFDTLTKLTKNHPLKNVIGDLSRPV